MLRPSSLEEDMRAGLCRLSASGEFSDIVLIGMTDRSGEERTIEGHRLVLSMRSKVMGERLREGGRWHGKEIAEVEFANFEVMQVIVLFLYTDLVEWTRLDLSSMAQIREAATVFDISRLVAQSVVAIKRLLESTRSKPGWCSSVLAIQQFALATTSTELGLFCMTLFREVASSWTGQVKLLRSMHDPLSSLLPTSPLRFPALVAANNILELFPSNEAMRFAVLTGRADVVEEMINRNIDSDTASEIDGLLPVEIALKIGRRRKTADDEDPMYALIDWPSSEDIDDVVQALILCKRHSNTVLKDKDQPMLNLAAKLGNAAHVRALIRSNSDVNVRDPVTGRSPLHCAAEAGFLDVVQELLDGKAVPNIQDNNGCTALHLSSRRGHVNVVSLLLPVVNENMPDEFGWTALHHAARKGHAEVTRLLLQECRNPFGLITATEYDQGSTAAHLASANGHYRVVLVMLNCAREADQVESGNHVDKMVNARDLRGRSPLHRAAALACDAIDAPNEELFGRASKLVDTLLEAQSDVIALTKHLYTSLHYALGGKDENYDNGGSNPLLSLRNKLKAVQTGERQQRRMSDKLLAMLLGHPNGSAAIRFAGTDGVTPLHLAVRFGHTRAVSLLVQRGAVVNVPDKSGASPLSIAREYWPLPALANSLLKLLPSPPEWVDDAVSNECESCDALFSISTRRHHCRHCGSVVCGQCSRNFVAIPKFGIDKPVRVCNGCHEALSWPSTAEWEEDAMENSDASSFVSEYQDTSMHHENDLSSAEMAHNDTSMGSHASLPYANATSTKGRYIKVKAKKRGVSKPVSLD